MATQRAKIEALSNNRVLLTVDDYTAEYWCPLHGGYVRHVDDEHPGTLGSQVCIGLRSTGSTLYVGNPDKTPLINLIRREWTRGKRGHSPETSY